MGHGIFKLQCFVLYKRQHVFPTDNHATKEHTCLYSIFLLTNTDFRVSEGFSIAFTTSSIWIQRRQFTVFLHS